MNAAVTAAHPEWALTCAYMPNDFEFMPRMIEEMGGAIRSMAIWATAGTAAAPAGEIEVPRIDYLKVDAVDFD